MTCDPFVFLCAFVSLWCDRNWTRNPKNERSTRSFLSAGSQLQGHIECF
jgi:hypothetical protein